MSAIKSRSKRICKPFSIKKKKKMKYDWIKSASARIWLGDIKNVFIILWSVLSAVSTKIESNLVSHKKNKRSTKFHRMCTAACKCVLCISFMQNSWIKAKNKKKQKIRKNKGKHDYITNNSNSLSTAWCIRWVTSFGSDSLHRLKCCIDIKLSKKKNTKKKKNKGKNRRNDNVPVCVSIVHLNPLEIVCTTSISHFFRFLAMYACLRVEYYYSIYFSYIVSSQKSHTHTNT